MQGKILIVDAIATNRIVLKVKLSSAFYDVLQADSVAQAVQMARAHTPDLILCALDLPGERGVANLVGELKTDATARHVPVVAIGHNTDAQVRSDALRAGVRDVLDKPLDITLLLARVRSLIRAHNASAEWRMHEDTDAAFGLSEASTTFERPGQYMMISPDGSGVVQHWRSLLRPTLGNKISLSKGGDLLRDVRDENVPDVFILVAPQDSVAAAASLQLISTLRAHAATRHAGILVVQPKADATLGAQALDLGADDLMAHGFEAQELTLRAKSLHRRLTRDAQLRAAYRKGVKEAIHDPLTGLHNRRYAMPHLTHIDSASCSTGSPYAVMVADLDHFKQINDHFGHASGDAVLVEVAKRLRAVLRSCDMVARIGGEEFLIAMPDTSPTRARAVALRICNSISCEPFDVPGSMAPVNVTISIGMAIGGETKEFDRTDPAVAAQHCTGLLDKADRALYAAKVQGRNRVDFGSRPAA